MRTAILLGREAAWRLFSFFLVCFLALIDVQGAEPQHQGKPASYWIKAYTVGMTEEDYARSGGKMNWDGNAVKREMETREKASEAFKEMGPAAVPYVVSWIKSADALAYRFGKQKGENREETKKPLPSWVTAGDVEWRGLEMLKQFGPGGKEALPVIMEHLNNSSVFTAGMACEALASLEAEAEPALPVLVLKLSDRDRNIRAWAASAIGGIIRLCPNKEKHKIVLEQLIRALKDDFKSVRWNSASAIGNFAEHGKDAVPALMESLRAGNEQAANALRSIGPAAKAAVPLLLELTTSKDEDLKERAIRALQRIDPEALKQVKKE